MKKEKTIVTITVDYDNDRLTDDYAVVKSTLRIADDLFVDYENDRLIVYVLVDLNDFTNAEQIKKLTDDSLDKVCDWADTHDYEELTNRLQLPKSNDNEKER